LVDISEIAVRCGFKVFESAIEAGGRVHGLNAKGCGHFSRKDVEDLQSIIEPIGAKGLAYYAELEEGDFRSSFAKFFSEEGLLQLKDQMQVEAGDLLLFVADQAEVVYESLSHLRMFFGDHLGLRDPNVLGFCWVIDFPLVNWNEDEQRWDPSHHLFTSPMLEDISLLDDDPARVRGQQYDVVLNGYEAAGGSIRIHDRQLQEKVFALIGLDPEQARDRFGHMLSAFEYGTPPHGGIASGIDRLCMVLAKEPNIREVIAFPKNQAARDVMAGAPSPPEPGQLEELKIKVNLPKA
jgi:aspartyl-tRNA synthetase